MANAGQRQADGPVESISEVHKSKLYAFGCFEKVLLKKLALNQVFINI